MIETSIIIRTRNEEKWLETVLQKLFDQTYKNFEVILVDSGSNDGTLEIAKKFPVKIYEILQKNFSYPYALNYGIEKTAESSKFIVIISGHSIPISQTWLEDGIENFKRHEKIMGVYGFVRAMPGASICDKGVGFFWRLARPWCYGFGKNGRYVIESAGMGVMGFTNAIILKELWVKKKFNEEYGMGGEDWEWADCWFKRGYKAVRDIRFSVYHSHDLGPIGWYRQFQYWKSLSRPQPFKFLAYRKDKTHSF
jgi:rhamnosyltransferase